MGEAGRELPVDEYVARHGVVAAIGAKRVASLLLTYRCTLACAHCLFACSPRHPRRVHSVEQGVRYLRMLRATDRAVHIAGGEAMMEYPRLVAICREAARWGAAPHFVESNTTWCTSDALVRTRLAELREAGVRGLLISADPYHLAHFPVDRYLRGYQVAAEMLGPENVAGAVLDREQLRELGAIGRDPARLAEYVRAHPPNMVGRAGEVLARHLPVRAIGELAGDAMWHGTGGVMSCAQEFDPQTMWEIHLDPYGNVQTCCGVIVGNADRTPLGELMARGFAQGNPIVAALCEQGPVGLLRMAEGLGYRREQYVQKCHLCWRVRKFLRPHFPEVLGPEEVYGEG